MKIIKYISIIICFVLHFSSSCLDSAIKMASDDPSYSSISGLSCFINKKIENPNVIEASILSFFVQITALAVFIKEEGRDLSGFDNLFRRVGGSAKYMKYVITHRSSDINIEIDINNQEWFKVSKVFSGITSSGNCMFAKFRDPIIESREAIINTRNAILKILEDNFTFKQGGSEQKIFDTIVNLCE